MISRVLPKPPSPPKCSQNRWKVNTKRYCEKEKTEKHENRCSSGRPHMQSTHACAVQTHFFLLDFACNNSKKRSKRAPKIIQKASTMLPIWLPEPPQTRCRKKDCKKTQKLTTKYQTCVPIGATTGGEFTEKGILFSTGAQGWPEEVQGGHQSSKMVP